MIDDHAMVRDGTRMLLEKAGVDCELVEAGSWREAERAFDTQAEFDWVILDLGLPDVAGARALELVKKKHVPVLVVSASEDRALVLDCINRGAAGFVGKSANGDALVEALRCTFAGGVYLPAGLFGRPPQPTVTPEFVTTARRAELARLSLTPRQIEVLELMVQGLSNRAIAARLKLAEATVKSHVAASLRALNVRNRTQAVFVIAQWGHGAAGATGARAHG